MEKIKQILFSKKHLKRDVGITILSFLVSITAVSAGNLDSPGSPGSTMYTLNDIYQRLMTNQTASEGDHEFKPTGEPTSSFHTLKEIYEAIPTIDPTKIKIGTSYLGVSGTLAPNDGTATAADLFIGKTANMTNDWNVDTGTLNLACATDDFNAVDNRVANEYDGSGNGSNRWCMTDSGTALATEILTGKKAWVDGAEINGIMPNIGQQTVVPGPANQAITLGYHDGTGYVEGDADLISDNIKSGVNIFGINGNSNVVSTESGDALVENILSGKKAWVDGSELTGAMANIGGQSITPSASEQVITQGYHDGSGRVAGDADLISDNIRSGITIFGIDGNSNVVNTSSGTAGAGDILSGKIGWIAGQEVTGSMPNIGGLMITPGTDEQTITLGYHDGTGRVAGDSDLISDNVKSGVTIFGVSGNSNVVNTQTGDAIASEIVSGKKAWIDGIEITGSMTSVGAQIITPGTSNQSITQGYHDGTGYVTGDSDLTAANIKGGVNIFGVAGGFVSQEKTATTEGEEVTPDSGKWLSRVVVAITNLLPGNIKKGVTVGGVEGALAQGYPGTGWEPNESGDGSTALNQTNCENAANWKWFEDANGDGDTSDPEDGECIRTATVNSDSWNGAEQITPNNLGTVASPIAASGGTANSITVSGASWTADAYKNHIVKIKGGTANNCWGRVKTNTNNTITVYGSWLSTAYASSCGTPDGTSTFIVSDDWGQYDNSWIGDYSCSGDFPNGTVVHGSYPTSGTIALAVTDCYDGKRDLLPNEIDRAVINGTATSADATSITDSSQSLDPNVWIGQKVLVTGGTGSGSYGFIESNTATAITVTDWLGGDDPGVGSAFKIIYIVPHAGYVPDALTDGDADDAKANNGPLMAEQLNNWKGTRLPSSSDFFGFCGYRNGGSDYENTTGANSANKSYGNYGGQVGRTDEFMDLANSGSWEWLSEQHHYYTARIAGVYACSYFNTVSVHGGGRFRSVFRP